MMIHKRLINTVQESKKYIAGNVALQWLSLAANIGMILTVSSLLQKVSENTATGRTLLFTAAVILLAAAIRYLCSAISWRLSFLSSKAVKETLRRKIYQKLLRLGISYKEQTATSEVVQVAVEGVDQLETYFGAYLPQFFISMLAPLTLFGVLCLINVPAGVVLLVCVPLIPISIALVQTFAKKLLAKYWGRYTALGDTFLENLQGLTTMKIYQADAWKGEEMERESENFRKITMKVLTMQLNSVTIMDIFAYGGAALGVIIAAAQYQMGEVTLAGGITIILLSAEFFIPMRLLGSYFHIAMNGMAASDKIFRLLDLPEENNTGTKKILENTSIRCEKLRFSYEQDREILKGISLEFPMGSFRAVVGESGCGKSTAANVIMGRSRGFGGRVTIGGISLQEISEDSLMKKITYVGFDSCLFKGSVRENLLMGDPGAADEKMWAVLKQVNLSDFLHCEKGLDTKLDEKGSNFSGGQRQRLALARAILHDSAVYIFDEATSNVDVESENEIMEQIIDLAQIKTVILITHRLANAAGADKIYVIQEGCVAEEGNHKALLDANGLYARLWEAQSSLEFYKGEAAS